MHMVQLRRTVRQFNFHGMTTCPYKKKRIIDHLSPKSIKRKEEDKIDRTLVIEIEIDHTVGTDKDKTLDPAIEDSHKTDNMDVIVGEEVIDVKIMIIEITVEIEGDQTIRRNL